MKNNCKEVFIVVMLFNLKWLVVRVVFRHLSGEIEIYAKAFNITPNTHFIVV